MIFGKNFPLLVAGLSILDASDVQATENKYEFQLVGTMEAPGEESRALIEISGKPVAIYCAAGRSCRSETCTCLLGNARIESIGREHIWILSDGKKIKVQMGIPLAGRIEAAAIPATAQPSPPPGPAQFLRMRKRKIQRSKIVQSSEVPETRQQRARLVADSLFGNIGIRPSDTIVKIQGVPFDASSSWGGIADLLKSQEKIFIEILRSDKPMLFKIQVRE